MLRDRDALICDMAETYHIYDITSIPVHVLAVLACGLRDESRSKMSMHGERATQQNQLLAAILDSINIIAWQLCGQGDQPKSILAVLTASDPQCQDNGICSYNTATDFEAAWTAAGGA